jgi:hypothetical protein
LEDLKKNSITVRDHESIVNREIEKVIISNQIEIESIKIAFEKELRKAEKQLRDSARKEEVSVRSQLTEALTSLEVLKRDKQHIEATQNT